MKTRSLILASSAMLALNVSFATAGPCTVEIDSVTKTLAAKDAGSGPTPGAGSGGTQSSATPSGQHPPTAILGQEIRAGQHLLKTYGVRLRVSLLQRNKGRPALLSGVATWVRQAARWIVHEPSTSRARKPNAWMLCERPKDWPGLIEPRRSRRTKCPCGFLLRVHVRRSGGDHDSRKVSRDSYVDGPLLARVRQRADRIACDHMSGLLMAVHMTACQDGFRDESSKQSRDVKHRWVPRSVSRLGSIDHTICSVS